VAVVLNGPADCPEFPPSGASRRTASSIARRVCEHFLRPCRLLHDQHGSEVLLNTFFAPLARPLGNLEARLPAGHSQFLRRLNVMLADLAPRSVHLNDVAGLVERHGALRALDQRLWFHAKQPFAPEFLLEYCRNTAAILAARSGRSRRVLVLDLDDTLWGGVLGEDGLEGLRIGEGSAEAEAFKAFQQYLLALRQRGVVLAICSKNEPELVERALREHPELVLRRDDFAAIRANWLPKSRNLADLAQELSLSLRDFVFVDDNPAERDEVRRAWPEVAVVELGDDPAEFPLAIEQGRFFETVAVSDEDSRRTESYRVRSDVQALSRRQPGDLSAFLASLEMRAVVRPFQRVDLERVTQLVHKTNQFNVTTRRLRHAELAELAASRDGFTRSVRLRDRFGDHGLIAVLHGRIAGAALRIEGWLMSCRVLQRTVEEMLLNHVVEAARQLGLREIVGHFVPSGRNRLVADLYPRLGFVPLPGKGCGNEQDAGTWWSLALDGYRPAASQVLESEDSRSSQPDSRERLAAHDNS
jgi:FkbH-like protein